MDVPLLLSTFVASVLFAWSLAAPPGPGNALIAQEAARRGWRAGLWTGAGAITADLLMFLLTWLGVLRLLALVPWLQVALGAGGVALLLRFAWDAWVAARRPATVAADARGGFAKTFLSIVSSPFNHAWWLAVGTSFFERVGVSGGAGFFAGLIAWVMFWSWLARTGAARIRRFTEWVGYASAAVLVVFAVVIAVFALERAVELLRA